MASNSSAIARYLTMQTAMLVAHHLVCLGSHLYASYIVPAAYPYYFAGVVSLEVGSAATCIHALWHRFLTPPMLLAIVTLSHVGAAWTTMHWSYTLTDSHPIGAWVGAIISFGLMLARQNDAVAVWRDSRS